MTFFEKWGILILSVQGGLSMFEAILFDFDGTVIDTNELIIFSYKYTLKKVLDYE